jgi:hypothetical protein
MRARLALLMAVRIADAYRCIVELVGAEPDARGSANDADVLSRFWFSSRSHSGSLSFHLRVGLAGRSFLRDQGPHRPARHGKPIQALDQSTTCLQS